MATTGAEVAKLSVKVSPDTSKFRRELRADLEAIERQENADVPVGADTKKLRAEVAAATRGLTAEVDVKAKEGALDRFQRRTASELSSGMNRLEVKINLDNAGEQFRRDIERASKDLDALIRKPIPKDIAGASARRTKISEEIAALKALGEDSGNAGSNNFLGVSDRQFENIQRLTNIRRIAAEQDDAAFRRRMANIDRLENIRRITAENEQRDHDKRMSNIARLNNIRRIAADKEKADRERLDTYNREANERDRRNRRRLLTGSAEGLGGSLSLLKRFTPRFGSGMNPAAMVVVLAGVIALAAPLLGLLSTAILAIPGLIAAVATPFAAIALGMDGIKKAAEASGLLMKDADGNLKFGPVLDDVKKQVSEAFAIGLEPVFTDLKNALPKLLASLPAVATGLSDILKGFTNALTSDSGIKLFDETIRNIGAAMTQSAPGWESFTNGMLRITTAFSRELPGLSTWFNKTGDSFDKWVKTMTSESWFTGTSPMGDSFKQLGDTLRTVGDWAIDLAKEGMNFIQDQAKMDNFIATLKNLGTAITNLIAIGNNLGPVWEFLAGSDAATSNSPTPSSGSGGGAGGGGSESSSEKQRSREETIKSFQEGFKRSGVVEGAAKSDSFFGGVMDRHGSFLQGLAEAFTGAKDALGANNDIGAGSSAFAPIEDQSPEGLKSLSETYKNESDRLQGEISELKKSADAALESNGGEINAKAQGYLDDLTEMQGKLDEIKSKAAEVQAAMSPEVALKSFSTPLTEGLIGELNKVPTAVATTLQQTKDLIGSSAVLAAPAAAQAAPEPIKVPEVDTSSVEAGINKVPELIGKAGEAAGAKAAEIPGKVTAGLGDMTGIGSTAGNQVVAGFIAGLSNIGGVQEAARGLARAAKEAANAELGIKSPSKVFEKIGGFTAEGFGIGLENGFQPVLDRAKALAGQVADAYAAGNVDPSGAIEGVSSSELKSINKVLGIEQKRLEMQAKALAYKGDKEGAARIRAQKDELGLQKDMLSLTEDMNEASGEDPLVKAASGLMKSPVDFAKATGQQFMSDIGIGGNGLISKAITEGINYVFNIGSVDEALDVKNRAESNQALAVVGRQ